MLCNFPLVLLNKLLSSWLTLPEIGRVDSALCSSHKDVFLQSLRVGRYCGEVLCTSEAFLRWVSKYKVHITIPELTMNLVMLKNGDLRNSFLSVVGKFLQEVTSKDLPNANNLATKALLDFSLYCTNLQQLEIQSYTDAVVVALLARNPNMRRVLLHDCITGESDILHSIIQLCPCIEAIDVHAVLSSLSVSLFMESSSSALQILNIPTFHNVTWKPIFDILSNYGALRQLHVGKMYYCGSSTTVPVFPQLLLFRAEFDALHIQTLAQLAPNLQTLVCVQHHTDGHSDNNIVNVLRGLPRLRQFADDKNYKHLLRPHPLPPMTAACIPGTHFLIEELYCTAHDVTYRRNVWKCDLNELIPLCPALRAMNVQCVPLSRAETILQPYSAASLKVLLLRDAQLRDSELLHLVGFEELEIECGAGVSDKGMGYVALRNPELAVLKVTQTQSTVSPTGGGNRKITNEGLWTFLQRCPHLRHVTYVTVKPNASGTSADTQVLSGGDLLLQKVTKARYPNLKHLECRIDL